jgi:hypothetical protein
MGVTCAAILRAPASRPGRAPLLVAMTEIGPFAHFGCTCRRAFFPHQLNCATMSAEPKVHFRIFVGGWIVDAAARDAHILIRAMFHCTYCGPWNRPFDRDLAGKNG